MMSHPEIQQVNAETPRTRRMLDGLLGDVHKQTKIESVAGTDTRPLTDLTRESLDDGLTSEELARLTLRRKLQPALKQ